MATVSGWIVLAGITGIIVAIATTGYLAVTIYALLHSRRQAAVSNPVFVRTGRVAESDDPQLSLPSDKWSEWQQKGGEIRWTRLRFHNLAGFGLSVHGPERMRVGWRRTEIWFPGSVTMGGVDDTLSDPKIPLPAVPRPLYMWRKRWPRRQVLWLRGTWETDLGHRVRLRRVRGRVRTKTYAPGQSIRTASTSGKG
jgi:hypothetical protein